MQQLCIAFPPPISLKTARPPAEFDAAGLVGRVGKGKSVQAIVEAVSSGSTLRVTLLPDLQSATVMVAGVQCPSMGRRPLPTAAPSAPAAAAADGEGAAPAAATTAASIAAAAGAPSSAEAQPEPFAREAKYFAELRCLNREVKLTLEGVSQVGALPVAGLGWWICEVVGLHRLWVVRPGCWSWICLALWRACHHLSPGFYCALCCSAVWRAGGLHPVPTPRQRPRARRGCQRRRRCARC